MLVGVKGSIVKDRRDSRFLPSEGDIFRVGVEQVVGTDTFTRVDGNYAFYNTLYTDSLGRKHILATRAGAGYIFGDAPVFEKYYGGGIGSIRGFHYRGVGPRAGVDDDPIGGRFELLVGTEYSFPIVGEDLRGVVFIDAGTVTENVAVTPFRASVGVGVEWRVKQLGPQPMQFYLAVPIAKDDKDDTEIFSFSVGFTW
jgi:outer membrane protein assembly factor BamA